MNRLMQLHNGPHLYGPGGIGWRALEIAPFVRSGASITRTLELPGFVERGVTYESHRFWLHWIGGRDVDGLHLASEVLIVVNHGAGWEVWSARFLLAEALCRYGEDHRGLFKMAYALIQTACECETTGAQKASDRFRRAFAEGRLRKRKMPGRNEVKVWIEDSPEVRAGEAA